MPKASSKSKTASLMTVGQIIDSAFGTTDNNRVNFKMMQTVMLLLARQLRILQRQVVLESDGPITTSSDPNIVVSEIIIKDSSTKTKPSERASTMKSTATSDTGPKISKAAEAIGEILPKRLSARKFELPNSSSVWSSGATSPQLPPVGLKRASSETGLINQKYYHLLEKIEEQREKVLRVISQRKNSHEIGVLTPSPMVSLASTEKEFEKLFLVEHMPEARELHKCLPIVTRDVFDELEHKVNNLEKRLDSDDIGTADFPENIKLMQELRKGASLTEAMAALQISARIDATEKVIQRIAPLVGDPGLDKKHRMSTKKILATALEAKGLEVKREFSSLYPGKPKSETAITICEPVRAAEYEDFSKSSYLYVKKEDFNNALEEKQAEIMRRVGSMISNINNALETNMKHARRLELKLGDAVNVREKVEEIERTIISTTHQLNLIDTGLTSQMTNLQEQLTLVQLDLESGLEHMNETLANKGMDTEMLSELNTNYTSLLTDIEKTGAVQRNFEEIQKKLSFDLERIKYDMELLRDIKIDRDEVEDALRDKAGIGDLNGMVSNAQHEATYSNLVGEIDEVYKTFRKQELTWQKAINDIFAAMDHKVDRLHLENLRDDISRNLNKLKGHVDHIKKVLGEPLAAGITRRIYRDSSCISCNNPAHLIPVEDIPMLPPVHLRVRGEIEKHKPHEDGDHGVIACITGLEIKHPVDTRAEICTRYCGGAHTKKRVVDPKESTLRLEGRPLQKPDIIDCIGTDGKVYNVEEEVVLKPCIPCNQKRDTGRADKASFEFDSIMGLTEPAFRKIKCHRKSSSVPTTFSGSFDAMDQSSMMPPGGSENSL